MLKKVSKLNDDGCACHKPEAESPGFSFDPLLPDAIALAAEDAGVKKAKQRAGKMFALSVLGGAFVALGGIFATVATAGGQGLLSYGVIRLIMGGTFSLGLILVVLAGAQLFTSDCLMVMAWASGRVKFGHMLKVWGTVWLGNLVGALGTALLLFLSGQYAFGHGEVGAMALYMASAKSTLAPEHVFFLAVFCNVLVCLAAWMAMAARSLTDKILAILIPVCAFVAAGFEHCVANMFFIPYGLLVKWGAPAAFWAEIGRTPDSAEIPVGQFLVNLGVATLGNWVGGALLVGAIYWLIFRRTVALNH